MGSMSALPRQLFSVSVNLRLTICGACAYLASRGATDVCPADPAKGTGCSRQTCYAAQVTDRRDGQPVRLDGNATVRRSRTDDRSSQPTSFYPAAMKIELEIPDEHNRSMS